MEEHPEYFRDYRPKRKWDVGATILGVVVAAVLVAGALSVVGFFVLLVVGLNNYGSNK